MPFTKTKSLTAEQWTNVFKRLLEPAIRACGYTCERFEGRYGYLATQMLRAIDDADLVVADITGGKPNVMWELGYRQGRHIGTSLVITQHIRRLPFYLRGHGAIGYSWSDDAAERKAARVTFQSDLQRALDEMREDPSLVDSPAAERDGESRRAAVWQHLKQADVANRMSRASKSVLVCSHTLHNVAYTDTGSLEELARRRVALKIVITDASPDNHAAHTIMSGFSAVNFRRALRTAHESFADWWRRLSPALKTRIEVKVAPLIPAAYYFVDPSKPWGTLHVVPLMPKGVPKDRMCILLEKRLVPVAYRVYYREFLAWFHRLPSFGPTKLRRKRTGIARGAGGGARP